MRVKNALNRLSQLRGRAVLLLMLLLMMQPYSLTAQDSTSEVIDTEVVDTAVAAIEEPDTAALPYIISLRKVPDSTVSAMQKQKAFAYANDPAYWTKQKEKADSADFWYYVGKFLSNKAVRMVFLVIMTALLLLALYFWLRSNNFIFSFRTKKSSGSSNEFTEVREQTFSLDERLQEAVSAGLYRDAVRWYYLLALQRMDEKGLIKMHSEASNQEYLQQMKNHPAAGDFHLLTRVYEYVWYGGLQPLPEQFELIQNRFNKFFKACAL